MEVFWMIKDHSFKVSAVNICTLSCRTDLFLKQEKHVLFRKMTRWAQKLCHNNNCLFHHSLSASTSLLYLSGIAMVSSS
jgi:hypothetical protein